MIPKITNIKIILIFLKYLSCSEYWFKWLESNFHATFPYLRLSCSFIMHSYHDDSNGYSYATLEPFHLTRGNKFIFFLTLQKVWLLLTDAALANILNNTVKAFK